MLRTRLWMGAILILLTVGMLTLDQRFHPWYPFLFVFFAALALLGTVELLALLAPTYHPFRWLCLLGVAGVDGECAHNHEQCQCAQQHQPDHQRSIAAKVAEHRA